VIRSAPSSPAVEVNCGWLEDDLSLPAADYLWSDYYASAAPVSNGPLPRRADRSHTDTSSLLPMLLPRIINDLVRAAYSDDPAEPGGCQLVGDDDIAASQRRRWLVRYLIGARIAAAGLVLAMWSADPGPAVRRPP
jgi:hypothetical protein